MWILFIERKLLMRDEKNTATKMRAKNYPKQNAAEKRKKCAQTHALSLAGKSELLLHSSEKQKQKNKTGKKHPEREKEREKEKKFKRKQRQTIEIQ